MLPALPALEIDERVLRALGRAGSSIDLPADAFEDAATDNPRITAGFPIFGQFIAHDITRDPSMLHQHATVGELRNFRTPRLDLEVVYGAGALAHPYFYDLDDSDKLLIGVSDAGEPGDVPRNTQGQALIADSRNDVHTIISQLHLAFLMFHNRIVDRLHAQGVRGDAALAEARRLASWHYQWTVVHEFLPLSVGEETVQSILRDGYLIYAFKGRPFIPVEFADAAYRFGHPQIRATYELNDERDGAEDFPRPRWFYVLKEAEIECAGERLGDVGGRIVAEVLLGILDGDPRAYLNVDPDWRPTLPGAVPGEFTMADLLVFAGAAGGR